MLRIAFAVSLLAATVGCSTIDSEDIETSGINASMEVARTNDGSNVSVSLSAGALNFVSLNNGDVLKATALGQTVELSENNLLNAISYFGRVDANAQGDEVTVSFERAEKTSAPSSTVVLPASVEITAPAASSVFSRANDPIVVEITGEASTDALRLSWSGDCVDADGLDVPADQTSVTINAGTIKKRAQVDENDPDSQPVPDSCTVSVRIERRVLGTLDGAFKGGSISAVTSSSRDITSNL
ncbi:MAG: hypothetical protein Q8O67_13900 [Deltaproteobacteria bacterium]|nr:hypothetical protein [Deltaproteobacteria bacterium]